MGIAYRRIRRELRPHLRFTMPKTAKPAPLTRATMSEAQLACFDLLCEVFKGEHHAPDTIHPCGNGIKCSVYSNYLSTFDFDYLSRLVVLAHDHCVRVEITSSAPGRVGLVLHKRHGREGGISTRHPTIEETIQRVRPSQP